MAKQPAARLPVVAQPKIQNVISKRSWVSIKAAWLQSLPAFGGPGEAPNPGVEHLPSLQVLTQPTPPLNRGRYADIDSLRHNVLADAVFLFHKCAHAHLATQRIGTTGMHSWSLFNAYHAAYLGARGILGLLGIALPVVRGQLLIDIFAEPETQKTVNAIRDGHATFSEFFVVKFGRNFDQQALWEILQRTLRQTDAHCIEVPWRDELDRVAFGDITKPRNAFLYHPTFWPVEDLLADAAAADYLTLCGDDLNAEATGFLMRLNFIVYKLFELLIEDLADGSKVIRDQIAPSRILVDPAHASLASYQQFLLASSQ